LLKERYKGHEDDEDDVSSYWRREVTGTWNRKRNIVLFGNSLWKRQWTCRKTHTVRTEWIQLLRVVSSGEVLDNAVMKAKVL
jgi:hypothetical protein